MLKIGDKIICQIETRKSGQQSIFARALNDKETMPKLEEKEFEIIAIQPLYKGSEHKLYTIAIDDNMLGWTVGKFKIEHQGVDPKFLGKKFWELTESFFKIKEIAKKDLK
jgi:hypothetical protein